MAYTSPTSAEVQQTEVSTRQNPKPTQQKEDDYSSSGESQQSSESESEEERGAKEHEERAAFKSRGSTVKMGNGRGLDRMVAVTPGHRSKDYGQNSQSSEDDHGSNISDNDYDSDINGDKILIDSTRKKRKMIGLGDSGKRRKMSSADVAALAKKYQKVLCKLEQSKKRIDDLERKVTVLRNAKKKKGAQKDPRTRQYISELRALIRYSLGRHKKFFPPKCNKWSDNPQTICQLVIKAIQWTPDMQDVDKIAVWNNVLAPNLNPLLSEFKNKIHQPMRHTFNCECNIQCVSHMLIR